MWGKAFRQGVNPPITEWRRTLFAPGTIGGLLSTSSNIMALGIEDVITMYGPANAPVRGSWQL